MKKAEFFYLGFTIFLGFVFLKSIIGLKLLLHHGPLIDYQALDLGPVTQLLIELPGLLVLLFFASGTGLTIGIFWIIALIKES